MPMKVSIGLSKKVGLPDYGSLGASCHVEVELDGALLQTDVEKFHQHVRRAYQACAQAVNEELTRSNGHHQAPAQNPGPTNGNGTNGNGHATSNGNGNGRATNGNGNGQRLATQSQVKAIYGIARNQRIDVTQLMSQYGVNKPEDLDIKTASKVIEGLKAQEGRQT
jgi:hypothetical protein